MLTDRILLKVARELERKLSRRSYEDILVQLGMYSLSTLRDNDEYYKLSKGGLIIDTLHSDKYELRILNYLFKKRLLSKELVGELDEEGFSPDEENAQQIEFKTSPSPKVKSASAEERLSVPARKPTDTKENSEGKEHVTRAANSKRSRLTKSQIISIVIPIVVALIGLLGLLITNWNKIKDGTQETEYVGRVIDSNSQRPIVGAKVTLDLQGVPPIVYTDSEGVYRFKVAIESNISGQIRIDAQGYQVYTRNITISPDIKTIEDIRLTTVGASIISTETFVPTPISTPTPNPTLIALYAQISTPNPIFTPQFRTIDNVEQAWVPEGYFIAGDTSGIGYDDERPFHKVYTGEFWIDRNLVTNSEYASCPESICSAPKKLSSHARPNGYYNVPAYGNYPVMNITWQQAKDFCEWRSGRLPTEAEFEKAAGWNPTTGLTLLYPWGDLAPTDDYANYNGIDRDTRPVGSYPKGMSPIGAYDMAGNTWEWMSDWYSETYYADNHDWNSPRGAADGIFKVIRGGSWFSNDTRWLRVSNRGKSVPDEDANEIGFRCVYEK